MDLRIEIPKRFKESLQQRFDLRRAKRKWNYFYRIEERCAICEYYKHNCEHCPFGKFGKGDGDEEPGCVRWIKEIIGDEFWFVFRFYGVKWWWEFDKKARKQIKELKHKAKKLITWV